MKLRNKISILIMALTAIFTINACKQGEDAQVIKKLDLAKGNALGAYFTTDAAGLPVLCWTEQMTKDSLYYLRYSTYDASSDRFNKAVTVPGSAGSSTAAESMAKIAFKADGTVMAIFGKRFTKEKSPYAGAIYYSFSKDQGKSWTDARFLHSDTAHRYGRSFFDVTRLKDGELAVVWLDGRFEKSIKGSALYFVKTEKTGGLGAERCLQKGTCECCRTNIISDKNGALHIAYRSIMYPDPLLGTQVRDMAYLTSSDGGKSFSAPQTISEDNWKIEGCPHSGPSLAVNQEGLHVLWFTAGGQAGTYFNTKVAGQPFGKRILQSPSGRHPQMAALDNGKLAQVVEEGAAPAGESHGAHGHGPAGLSTVVLSIWKNGSVEKQIKVSSGKLADHHAVLTPYRNGLLLAWVSEQHGQSAIQYAKVANL